MVAQEPPPLIVHAEAAAKPPPMCPQCLGDVLGNKMSCLWTHPVAFLQFMSETLQQTNWSGDASVPLAGSHPLAAFFLVCFSEPFFQSPQVLEWFHNRLDVIRY